jgi:hypothetical protein
MVSYDIVSCESVSNESNVIKVHWITARSHFDYSFFYFVNVPHKNFNTTIKPKIQ